MNQYYVLGRGGLHDIIVDILGKDDYLGFFDDKNSTSKYYRGELKYIGDGESLFLAIASIENMFLREKLLKKLKEKDSLNINAISQKANISKNVSIGNGNIILPFVQIGVNTCIGDGNVIFANTTIEHDSTIGNNVNIAPGVSIAGNVTIEDNVYIGVGANIIDGVIIRKNSIIGAGSTVLTDIEQGSIYIGAPAKKTRDNDLYRSVK